MQSEAREARALTKRAIELRVAVHGVSDDGVAQMHEVSPNLVSTPGEDGHIYE